MPLISITKLYDLLAIKLGRNTAEQLTVYIEEKIDDELATKTQLFATKYDLFAQISRLDIKIGETKAELIKWMFIFWIAQVASTFGFIFLFIKK